MMENLKIYEELLSLPFLKVVSVNIEKHRITMSCELDSASCKCTNCGHSITQVHQRYKRTVRDLNMASREVYLLVQIRQFYCKTCHLYFTESLDFADSNKSHPSLGVVCDYDLSLVNLQIYVFK